MRKKFLVVGLLAATLTILILVLTVLILATQEGRTPPTAITGLIATDTSYARQGQIDLFWSPSDAKDFAYYTIYASLTEITDVTELSPIGRINDRTDVAYQVTRYKVPGLRLALFAFTEDTEYWFGVTAVDLAGNESKLGTSVSATIEKMPPPTPSPADIIWMRGYGSSFDPETVTVPVGATIAWINTDGDIYWCFLLVTHHTVTSDTGLFRFELTEWNVSFSYTFTEAGVFGYHCELHPGETGKVIVVEHAVDEPGFDG